MDCQECGLQLLQPQPNDSKLAEIYSASYFLNDSDGISSEEVNCLKRETAAVYVNHILSLQSGKLGTLLEVGSGTGEFLLEAQRRGFQVRGIEYSADAVAVANQRLGGEYVQQGEVETANLPNHYFDIVFLADVIEHVRSPKPFVAILQQCLKPEGLIYIVTPSTDSWSRKLMGRRWTEYKIEHFHYFNRRSLTLLLEANGFDQIRFAPNHKILSLRYICAHFRRFRVPFWSSLAETMTRLIPAPLARRKLKIVASGIVATGRKIKSAGVA